MASKISVVVITLNEEKNIEDCLRSVLSVTDDIVVIDSGSTDRTVEIASRYASRVVFHPWQGDGPQRQVGVQYVLNDWVLNLDADERLAPGSDQLLLGLLDQAAAYDAFYLNRKSFLHGKWVRRSGWNPDYIPRLFHKKKAFFSRRSVHTKIEAENIGYSGAEILHFPFENYSHMLRKLDSYSSTLAEEMVGKGRHIKSWQPLGHGLWMFFRVYFLKLGFRDGVDGAAIALTSALGSFMKYAKALEMQNQRTDERSAR